MLPPSGGVLNVLDRVDPAPVDHRPGDADPAARPGDRRRPRRSVDAGGSVVRVLSTACGLGIEGSGWAVRPNLIVTNAHVVAGADDTTVTHAERGGARRDRGLLPAGRRPRAAAGRQSHAADPADHLGTARRGGGGGPRLSRERSLHGDPGADRRNPDDGQRGLLRARADRAERSPRSAATCAAATRAGRCSTAQGQVVGIVFAATTSGPNGGFAVPAEEVREAIHHASGPEVSTGACTR